MRKTLDRDLEMLKQLATTHKQQIATDYGLTLRGLDSWIFRIRERRREYRQYLNSLLAIERRNPRMRKMLLSTKLEKEELTIEQG